MAKYPIFLELKHKTVLIIGGGNIALRKAQALIRAQAKVLIIAQTICTSIKELCSHNQVEFNETDYNQKYLNKKTLVIAATDNMALNERIYQDCQINNIPCNTVDIPHLCDFYVPAVMHQGNLQIAVSTNGKCPAYAGYIRKKLEQMFTKQHSHFLDELGKIRLFIIKSIADYDKRKACLTQLAQDESFDIFINKGTDTWIKYAHKVIKKEIQN